MTTRTAILGAAAIAALVVQLGFAAPTAWAVEGVEGTPPPAETTTCCGVTASPGQALSCSSSLDRNVHS